MGLGYLSLDRAAPTLSGGEAQRIRLAAQLGSNLRGVCYVLDEPTIGLHPRDNRMLLDTLDRLEHKGNTIVVVEHDEETIRRAGHVLDLGPGAGVQGGQLVAQGTAEELARNPDSVTGRYLGRSPGQPARQGAPTAIAPGWASRVPGSTTSQDLDLRLPLGRLVCVTGVSGSGKSTLVREVLAQSLRNLLAPSARGAAGRARRSYRLQRAHRLAVPDPGAGGGPDPDRQDPALLPRNLRRLLGPDPALFAATPEARMLGWGPGRFSFNYQGGPLRRLRGPGHAAHGDELPAGRQDDLRGLRRQPLQHETREIRYKEPGHRRGAGHGRGRGVEVFAVHPPCTTP